MKLGTIVMATALISGGAVAAFAAPAAAGPAECPPGWAVQFVPPGSIYDKNGDGRICTKDIPGDGDGNSANSQRPPGNAGHVDGHNHKDNNPPS